MNQIKSYVDVNRSLFNIDFLNYKVIIGYVTVMLISVFSGSFLKDGIALIYVLCVIYYCFKQNLFKVLEVFIIWLSISNFFIGQGYITFDFTSKYIAKPSFLLFVIFLFYIKKIPIKFFKTNYIYVWIIFLILTLLSSITQGQSPFVVITVSSFFLAFLILQVNDIPRIKLPRILNLVVAIAILQTIVSILQVSGMISPPSTIMPDGSGGYFKWEAGIDDVASGTFGPAASSTTSWFASLIALFMLFVWAFTKKNKYLFVLMLVLIQFATVDSKTILGITIIMFVFAIIRIIKKIRVFKINFKKVFFILIYFSIFSFGFFKAWNAYYEYTGKTTESQRTDVKTVYQNEALESLNTIWDNIQDWGKIKGFEYIFDDFVQNNPFQLIWGYGLQGFDFNGKGAYIQSKDTPLMQLNNLTNSTSGLITQFAVSGFIGFIFFIAAIFFWFFKNLTASKNKFGVIKNEMLIIYFPFSIFAMFIYGNNLNSIPIIICVVIISIYDKLSKSMNSNLILNK